MSFAARSARSAQRAMQASQLGSSARAIHFAAGSRSSPVLGSSFSATTSEPLSHQKIPQTASLMFIRTKRSAATFAENVDKPGPDRGDAGDVPVYKTKGKGAKGAASTPQGKGSKRGKKEQARLDDDEIFSTSTKEDENPTERYDKKTMLANMTRSYDRCKQTVNQMVGMHGRADPAMLDPVKVTDSNAGDEAFPLRQYASVGVRDGALLVTCYDKDMTKQIERAIYQADLGLVPQQIGATDSGTLRIPVPKATAETRASLLTSINRICENARISIRAARQIAQKKIKQDLNRKNLSQDEAHEENKMIDEQTSKFQKEIEDFYKGIQKKMQSQD